MTPIIFHCHHTPTISDPLGMSEGPDADPATLPGRAVSQNGERADVVVDTPTGPMPIADVAIGTGPGQVEIADGLPQQDRLALSTMLATLRDDPDGTVSLVARALFARRSRAGNRASLARMLANVAADTSRPSLVRVVALLVIDRLRADGDA